MTPERPAISVEDLHRATAPESGTHIYVALTPDEILRLSDPQPGAPVHMPTAHKRQGLVTYLQDRFTSSRTSVHDTALATEAASNPEGIENASNEDWVVTAVQQAIERREIDLVEYQKIARTSVGKAAANMLQDHGVEITRQTLPETPIPEDIFKPAKTPVQKPPVSSAPTPTTFEHKNPFEKLKTLKQRADVFANFIPGYKGTKDVVRGLGAVATITAALVLPYKALEGIAYDTGLSMCGDNIVVCGGLKAVDGLIQDGMDFVDILLPGGKR